MSGFSLSTFMTPGVRSHHVSSLTQSHALLSMLAYNSRIVSTKHPTPSPRTHPSSPPFTSQMQAERTEGCPLSMSVDTTIRELLLQTCSLQLSEKLRPATSAIVYSLQRQKQGTVLQRQRQLYGITEVPLVLAAREFTATTKATLGDKTLSDSCCFFVLFSCSYNILNRLGWGWGVEGSRQI